MPNVKSIVWLRFFVIGAMLLIVKADMAQLPGKFQGQGPIKGVSTETRPVQKQWRGVFSFTKGDVKFRNDFAGARVNGIVQINDSTYSLLITSENTPVNSSPWYAFKVWSKKPQNIIINLTYQEGARHRYNPRQSKNGNDWVLPEPTSVIKNDRDTLASGYSFQLNINSDTTWIAAQELSTTAAELAWIAKLKQETKVVVEPIGQTHLARPLTLLKLGNLQSKNRVLIIGRQHPPEVTGQLAEQAFLQRIAAHDSLANVFREKFLVYAIPVMNPDGVDEGFWRHNAGGVDLNRDWFAFNQPETRSVRDYLAKQLQGTANKLWFALDFHSTHDDIFYIVDPQLKGLLPGFTQEWLSTFQQRIPNYIPNIKPLYSEGPTYTSFSYLFRAFGTEALVYEIGDNTSRAFIVNKSRIAAEAMMELLLKKVK